MNGFRKFKVIPDVPEKLRGLYDIAYNVWISWEPDAIKLFLRMDEVLWNETHHNPVKMLGEISQKRLEELAGDEGYVIEVERVRTKMHQYLAGMTKVGGKRREHSIAYFSLEYGLTEALPIYSGGLGILSGDHIKSSSDIALDLTGIGLLYQYGYFQQYLNQDGWQQDFYKLNEFNNMQVKEVLDENHLPVEIELELPERLLYLKIWQLAVGRVTIYFMDSNIEKNNEYDRKLTGQLYGGGREMRLEQEIILGIGGVRLLEKMGIHVNAIHMNEGHSSFAVFERSRQLMIKNGLSFTEAMEISRKSSVFTTHTPVPAGNDEFDPELIRKYFKNYVPQLGLTMEDFLKLGRIKPGDIHENYSMSVIALRHSAYVNGVSQLHGSVSRKMWEALWPQVPTEHIPIQAITNGVHIPTWLSFEMSELLRRYLGNSWKEKQDDKNVWKLINNVPDPELWRVRNLRRRRLVYFIRDRLETQLRAKGASAAEVAHSREALDPDALTIGFARRFATYKRGNLIFRDLNRLLKIINHAQRPVQLIFAGKAHPQDHAGKEIIKNIVNLLKTHKLTNKIIFIEDYDMNVARYMVQGVDVWLNNPLRPHEASGTSGMKVSPNGVLNLSIPDGWWAEAYDHENGWSIGNAEDYDEREYQDEIESKAIYSILESDVVPLFYDRDLDKLPREWIKIVKSAYVSIASFFNTHRMIKEYYDRFYQHAGSNFITLSSNDFEKTKELVAWKENMQKEFSSIRIDKIRYSETKAYKIREKMPVKVEVLLGKIKPGDINVDIYYGKILPDSSLDKSMIETLTYDMETSPGSEGRCVYSGQLDCKETGDLGFKVRITPSHDLIINPYEMNLVKWM
ncbi:MAG: glycosyltransferase family 1 protein [bacterium]|nr:glycosyltransferase family 1 protein [bacterium]